MKCQNEYPTRHFGSWCKCQLDEGHDGDHEYKYQGVRGTVHITWPNSGKR